MEASKHLTCLSYNSIDFLIQSQYILFGIYLGDKAAEKNITFENELLPHINIGNFLEETFFCRHVEDCNVMLVMQKNDFPKDIQKLITDYTQTKFPASGNFAISVNSSVSSKIMDITFLHLIPLGIRKKLNDCGISAIGFSDNNKRQILISPDNFLRAFIRGEKCE